MKDKTLNLEASQAIASLGIVCESESSWLEDINGYRIERTKIVLTIIEGLISNGKKVSNKGFYLAPSLQELFSVLPAIGEKLEIYGTKCYACAGCNYNNLFQENGDPCIKHLGYELLDIYLTNYDMEDVSVEIIRLIKEK